MRFSVENLSLAQIRQILTGFIGYLKELLIALLIIFLVLVAINLIIKLIRLIRHLQEPFLFLEITPPVNARVPSLATTQLFNQIIGLLKQSSFKDKIFLRDSSASFEIVSSKKDGIRYLVRAQRRHIGNIEKTIRSYLPSCKIEKSSDYLENLSREVIEFKQTRHFSHPLREHSDLAKHDPVNYLTGNIKKLEGDDLIGLQIVLTPLERSGNNYQLSESKRIRRILQSRKHFDWSRDGLWQKILYSIIYLVNGINQIVMIPLAVAAEFITGKAPEFPINEINSKDPMPADLEYSALAKAKLTEPLFAASFRVLVKVDNKQIHERISGITASVSSFNHDCGQSLSAGRSLTAKLLKPFIKWKYKRRLGGNLVLTTSETASIFHFPFGDDSFNEDLRKIRSLELPASLSIKNQPEFDVVFGKNTYAGADIPIGLTDDDRSRHLYMIGQTGSGKTTIIYHMAGDDIAKGRGAAVVEPHGDLAEDLLSKVPDSRVPDLIYFNPFDIKYPVGVNLLELTPGLDEDELELEKELVCESVVAIFRRVFFKDENVDAHRIEYILRNAIYTAFCQEDCTIFTVYDLLNNKDYRKQAIRNITDKNLLNFWRNEFGKAGDYQLVKMTSGVTSKIGRFLFSPIAKRILEQPKSTINFDEILDESKILICNLAEGKLGEDTSQLLGATVIAKIYQAAMRRSRIEKELRQPFYLFVDEFQNFATSSFTKVLSGGRK